MTDNTKDLWDLLNDMPVIILNMYANTCYMAELNAGVLPKPWQNITINQLMENAKDYIMHFYARHTNAPWPKRLADGDWDVDSNMAKYIDKPKAKTKVEKKVEMDPADLIMDEALVFNTEWDDRATYLTFQDIAIFKRMKSLLAFIATSFQQHQNEECLDAYDLIDMYLGRLVNSQKPSHRLCTKVDVKYEIVQLGLALHRFYRAVMCHEGEMKSTLIITANMCMALFDMISHCAIQELNKSERQRRKTEIDKLDEPCSYE